MKRSIILCFFMLLLLSLTCCGNINDQAGSIVKDPSQGAVTSVTLSGGAPVYYTSFGEAWALVDSNPDKAAVVTMLCNVNAESISFDMGFGDYKVLTLNARSAPVTLDLGGYTLDKKAGSFAESKFGCLFSLTNACDLTIKNGTLRGGYNYDLGGCIIIDHAEANLHLEGVTITKNRSTVQGGALFISSAGNVELTDCIVKDNYTDGHGGAFYMTGNTSRVTLKNCQVTDNISGGCGGGMYIYGSDSTLMLDSVTMTGNTAQERAGAIYWNENSGKMASIAMKGEMNISGNTAKTYPASANIHSFCKFG